MDLAFCGHSRDHAEMFVNSNLGMAFVSGSFSMNSAQNDYPAEKRIAERSPRNPQRFRGLSPRDPCRFRGSRSLSPLDLGITRKNYNCSKNESAELLFRARVLPASTAVPVAEPPRTDRSRVSRARAACLQDWSAERGRRARAIAAQP